MSTPASDLFGEPTVWRGATFGDQNRTIRTCLTRRWSFGPIALVIGCNPSRAGDTREDPTTHWLNRWFGANGFGGYDLMNLYPFVASSPRDCRRLADWENNGPDFHARDVLMNNLSLLAMQAKAARRVVVCWGNIAWDPLWIDHVVERIQDGEEPWPDLWCWGRTASGAPKHPMARGRHRMTAETPLQVWRAA